MIDELCKKYDIKKEDLNFRADGRIEWICEDGVGHTIYAPDGNYVHGCNGNCAKLGGINEKVFLGNDINN